MKIAVEIIGNEHLRVRGRSVAQWLSIWVIRWLSDATFEATCCGRILIMVSNVLRPVSSGHASLPQMYANICVLRRKSKRKCRGHKYNL